MREKIIIGSIIFFILVSAFYFFRYIAKKPSGYRRSVPVLEKKREKQYLHELETLLKQIESLEKAGENKQYLDSLAKQYYDSLYKVYYTEENIVDTIIMEMIP